MHREPLYVRDNQASSPGQLGYAAREYMDLVRCRCRRGHWTPEAAQVRSRSWPRVSPRFTSGRALLPASETTALASTNSVYAACSSGADFASSSSSKENSSRQRTKLRSVSVSESGGVSRGAYKFTTTVTRPGALRSSKRVATDQQPSVQLRVRTKASAVLPPASSARHLGCAVSGHRHQRPWGSSMSS